MFKGVFALCAEDSGDVAQRKFLAASIERAREASEGGSRRIMPTSCSVLGPKGEGKKGREHARSTLALI